MTVCTKGVPSENWSLRTLLIVVLLCHPPWRDSWNHLFAFPLPSQPNLKSTILFYSGVLKWWGSSWSAWVYLFIAQKEKKSTKQIKFKRKWTKLKEVGTECFILTVPALSTDFFWEKLLTLQFLPKEVFYKTLYTKVVMFWPCMWTLW